MGHTEGIAYLEGKNDGLHFISNSKDQVIIILSERMTFQTLKMWDIRKMSPNDRLESNINYKPYGSHWDYRMSAYPGPAVHTPHDDDSVRKQTPNHPNRLSLAEAIQSLVH